MANVFGTPVYVYSAADEQAGKAGNGQNGSASAKLKDVLKNLQPLEKTLTALENADKALDGTGYDDIRQAIQGVIQQATAKIQEMVGKIGGTQQPQGAPAQAGAPAQRAPAPTAGQIAGTEPLPGEKA